MLHAIVRDEAVQGISGFARDITRERENETRFTELFQTLREGVYLASADDRITEVNPALAQMLGFSEQGRHPAIGTLLALQNAADRAEERAKLDDFGFLRAREITLKHRQDGARSRRAAHDGGHPRSGRANLCGTRELLWTSPSSAKWNAACTANRNSRAA